MTPAAFWQWIWELNAQRPGRQLANGHFAAATKTDLARHAGVSESLFINQSNLGVWPTVQQARAMARVLHVSFRELERRAELRQEKPPEDIRICLSCPLPDCEAGENGCPLMRF